MNYQEAIKILKPEGDKLNDVKRAYRLRALEFHPDRNPHGLEMMKLVNAAYDALRSAIGRWTVESFKKQSTTMGGQKTHHYDFGTSMTDELQKIFDKIKHWPQIEVELIGDWMWVFGVPKEAAIKFAAWGFNYSIQRQGYYYIPKAMRGQKWSGRRKDSEEYMPFDEVRNILDQRN